MTNNNEKDNKSNKTNSKQKISIIISILICIAIISSVIVLNLVDFDKKDKKGSNVSDNEKLSKYYDIYTVSKKPLKEGIKINGNKVDLIANYYSIKFKEIHELKDVFIVEFEVLFTKKDDTYNGVLYAINKKGKVLWYENPASICSDDDSLCRGVIGYHFSEDFDYRGHYYKIGDDKITFVSEVLTVDPIDTACSMGYWDDFTVEYEIDYLGNEEFSEMKKINTLTAGQYIDREKENGVDVVCD